MHRRAFVIVLLSWIFVPSFAIAACPCPPKSTGEKIADAQVVFLGTIRSIRELGGTPRYERITFDVQKAWKGSSALSLDIVLPVSVDACGLTDELKDRPYLVFAKAQTDGTLSTSVCNGTDLAEALQRDITMLDQLYSPFVPGEEHFPDVPADSPYIDAITELRATKILGGYPDGTFRPDWPLSRVEALKLLIRITLPFEGAQNAQADRDQSVTPPFRDLDSSAWYMQYVRTAYSKGFIKGFPDGTFRPGVQLTVAEASSLVSKGFHLPVSADAGVAWYDAPVRSITDIKSMPPSIRSVDRAITRAEFAEMLWRLSGNITNRESATANDLLYKKCVQSEDRSIRGVDLGAIRAYWIGLYNSERSKRGLQPYSSEPQLDRSAALWSNRAADNGSISHERDTGSGYYDYAAVLQWFSDLGLEFSNIGGSTFTENIGWGPYACSDTDCTSKLMNAIKTTFDLYLSEEPKSYRPHFNAIVNPNFRMLGVAVAVRGNQYFITTHFGTKITSKPAAVCGR